MIKYTIEDKRKYIELIKSGKHSLRSAGKEAGVSKSVGERWWKTYESVGFDALLKKTTGSKNFSSEFKLNGIKYMQENHLSLNQASIDLGISSNTLARWEKIYLEEGEMGFYPKEKSLKHKTMKKNEDSKLSISNKETKEDLIKKNEKLEAEIAYLKKCIALVQEKTKSQTKKKL